MTATHQPPNLRSAGRLRPVRDAVGARLPASVAELLAPSRWQQAVVCARHTRQPGRFAAREILAPLVRERRGTQGRYVLSASGLTAQLRHGTVDVGVLSEIFELGLYAVPPPALAAIAATAEPSIVDLGAHIGLFGLWALERFPAARLLAFEPDPHNFAVLGGCIRANGLEGRWAARNACAASGDGTVMFATGRSSGSRVTAEASAAGVVAIAAVDVLPIIASADVLKMDVEGSEWEILTDPRFRQAAPRVIVLEYHPHLCPAAEPRDLARSSLSGLGYTLLDIFHDAASGVGMLWAVRPPGAS